MARAKQRPPQVEQLRPYLEGVGKNLTDKLYGPDGPAWGTKLSEIEAVLGKSVHARHNGQPVEISPSRVNPVAASQAM